MKKKGWIFLLVIVLLLAVALVGFRFIRRRVAKGAEQSIETATVYRGDIDVVVKATGSLVPHAEISLPVLASGRVAEVLVQEGSIVATGQPLLRLDTTELELQLAQSQANLLQAQANLTKTLTAIDPEDVTVSQNSLTQAQNSLHEQETTLATGTEQARLSWTTAANNVRDAQARYSQIYWENRDLESKLADLGQAMPQENIDSEAEAWRAVENAQAAMEQARLSYEQAQERQSTSLSTARSQVSTAQANLAKLTEGVPAADIAAAQASVEQARVAVEQAQVQLDKATLAAPWGGTVTAVNVQVGEWAGTGQPAIVLSDLAALEVQVNLDETDVARVVAGQQVRVQVDAFPGVEISGQVSEISLNAQSTAGVVLYPVTLRLEATKAPVRLGMTAEATIVTARQQSTLLIPLRAVETLDGKAYVQRVVGGKAERIEVTLGLMNDTDAEITGGLAEGDEVALIPVPETTTQQQGGLFRGMFGGLR